MCNMLIAKSQTAGIWIRLIKKEFNIIRLKYIEVNYEATFENPPNYSKHFFF